MDTIRASEKRSDLPSMKKGRPPEKPVSLAMKSLQLGVLGRFFGDKDHAAFNVAGVLTFLLFALLVAVAYFPVAALTPALIIPLLTLTIGYMFGDRRR